jgi:hypothetical protein
LLTNVANVNDPLGTIPLIDTILSALSLEAVKLLLKELAAFHASGHHFIQVLRRHDTQHNHTQPTRHSA